jgi:predicted DNA-binding antitoxin AbrB/MazE fold protein
MVAQSMKKAIDAIYQNGSFKPMDPDQVHLPEGRRVTLIVDDQSLPESLRLAARVYDGLSPAEIREIEEIALDRSRFTDRTPTDS